MEGMGGAGISGRRKGWEKTMEFRRMTSAGHPDYAKAMALYRSSFPEHELRGRKYGQRALEKLNEKGKTVILEIDPPVDEISIRRKGFYERCGFRANPYEHVHPAYHRACEGHRLVVMSCPGQLTGEQYDAFAAYLGGVVMKGAFEA